ncbi:hypothetical protein CSW15_06220, partial [Thermus scotoductus]|uniref:hypothetical protein n=1 Tax=Thermus scotoductus TaxID=37636 RepID=UPI001003CC02
MKRLFPVLFLLSPALGAKPGEVAILPFPGLPPGALEVASDLPLLLAPQASDGGVVLVAVEVPPRFPPGSYRVCLGPVGGEALCREVTVEALAKLRAKVPGEAVGGSLRLALKNEGNLPLRVWLSPAEGSEVFFPPLALSLLPGEEGEAELSLSGFGLLRLRVASEAGEAFYLVRVRPEGGKPLPYTLSGLLEGGYALGTGTSLRLALEGALSREARLALALEGPHPSLRLGVGTGGFSLGFRATGC